MSIIHFEGFDLYGQDVTDFQTGLMSRSVWTSGIQRFSDLAKMIPRNNGLAFSPDSGNSTSTPVPQITNLNVTPTLKAVAGMAFLSDHFAYYGQDDGPTVLHINSSFVCKLWPNGGAPGTFKMEVAVWGTSYWIDNLSHEIWHYVEMEQDDTSGSSRFKVWLNGTLQVNHYQEGTLQAPAYYTGMSGCYGNGDPEYPNRIVYDDMYFLDCMDDSHGAKFQERLGPITIRPANVVANGVNSFVPVGAASNWEAVKEAPGANDLDATYATTSAAPRTQAFKAQVVDSNNQMLAIMTVAAVKQSTPAIGIADLSFYANDGTAQVDASGVVLQNSYRQFTQNYAVMPNGGAVSAANLAAAEWGILVEEGA